MHGFVDIWRFPLGSRFPVNFRPLPASSDRIEGIFVLTKLWASFWYIEIGFWWTFVKNPNFGLIKGIFGNSLFTSELGNFGNLVLIGSGFG